jgi:hypothetical protein
VYIWATATKTPEGHVGYEAHGEQKFTNVTSRPEPFLHNPQKKFGTPRVSIVHGFAPVPRGRVGHPPTLRPKMFPTRERICPAVLVAASLVLFS